MQLMDHSRQALTAYGKPKLQQPRPRPPRRPTTLHQKPDTSATSSGPALLAPIHHQVGLHHDEAGVALRLHQAPYNPGSKTLKFSY